MRLNVARTAGFCMGVRRAVEMALDAPAKYHKPIYTYGPLIHNPQVLALFEEKGVKVLDTIPEHGSGTVLIRAHGVPPSSRKQLKAAGFKVIDATCPRVVKVQSIIKSYARKGFSVIIIGDHDHPEVIGLLGFAGDKGYVVEGLDAIKALPAFEQAIVVAQTTQNKREYKQINAWVAQQYPNYKVFNTICDSTERRQAEVRRIARESEAVVVVGGKNSGNTQRLAEIVRYVGKPAYHVETESELDYEALSKVQNLGITAGASTPSWIIKRVLRDVEQIPLKRRQGWASFVLGLQRFLLLSNLYVALGAGCLCYATIRLQGITVVLPSLSAAMFYVLAMHTLNHLTGRAENRYNDPDREIFYERFKWPLTVMAVLAGTLGLVAAIQMGPLPFWTLLAMSLLGLSYNLQIIPKPTRHGIGLRRIKDLPGSKTILIALAWGVVTACLPALAVEEGGWLTGVLAFLWATGIAFCRTAYFDILDMQGDRIVGKETIPILLGPARSLKLLKRVSICLMGLTMAAGALGLMSLLAFPLVIPPLLLWGIIKASERGAMLPGIRMEFRVESLFVLCGVLAVFCALITMLCAA